MEPRDKLQELLTTLMTSHYLKLMVLLDMLKMLPQLSLWAPHLREKASQKATSGALRVSQLT
jgi:hypothetical protein